MSLKFGRPAFWAPYALVGEGGAVEQSLLPNSLAHSCTV